MTVQYGMDRALYEEALKKVSANPDPEILAHADAITLNCFKDLNDAFTEA